ncbi:Capsular polysaccharide synthesis enzyme CpsB [Vibrio rotiferianus]|uniref:outer membrane beta-barrel protein n=1 Tax=Vibrio rotiferianus TaxID=190895 RepID=UPI0028951556|nr:Capsular polysaccharide synthesis enzyme CpsB [Vibrio rotiferianus]
MRIKSLALAMISLLMSYNLKGEPMSYTTESGIELTPKLTLDYEYNDNIARIEKNHSPAVSVYSAIPSIDIAIERNLYKSLLSYKLDSGISSDESNNFNDHTVRWLNHFELNHRNRFNVRYQYQRKHENRGEGLTEGQGDTLPDLVHFQTHQLNTKYRFGANGARGNIELGINYFDKRYTNYRENLPFSQTKKAKYNDFRSPSMTAEFYMRMAVDTYWLIGTEQKKTTYITPNPNQISRDGLSSTYFTGVSWAISGKTTGVARIGVQDKHFDSVQREDFTGLSWDIGAEWTPQNQTLVSLSTKQAAINPDLYGDYNLQTRVHLTIEHNWNSYLKSDFSTSYLNEDYTGVDREEDSYTLRVGVDYQFRRWLSVSGQWQFIEKESNWAGYSYDQNLWSLAFNLSL